jgi:hypothetical protein
MGIGAVLGALTMASAVSTRTRDAAARARLRLRRGRRFGVVEAALLAVGGGFSARSGVRVFDGHRAATLNWDSFSMVTSRSR